MSFSLDYKIGQMVMIGFRGTVANPDSPIIKVIRDHHLGGVWLTDNESPMGHTLGNIRSPAQLKKLMSDLQSAARLPLLIAIDAEGGQVIRLKEKYGFPKTHSASYLGQKNDLDLTFRQSQQMAQVLKEAGINFNFAPVLDLNRNPQNPALSKKERCYSAEAGIVLRHARKVIEAHHELGILCCLKHFPGHGSSAQDTHEGMVDVSESWQEDELIPYQGLIRLGLADGILTAHIFNRNFDPEYPATLSEKIISNLLRKQLRYQGLVFTDDMNMGAIQHHYSYKQAVELAIKAGVDIILQSNVQNYQEDIAQKIIAIIKELVKTGRVKEERIEDSFQRIRQVKNKLLTTSV